MSNDIDIIGLAAQAKKAGYDSPERIVEGLEQIIEENIEYLNRPNRRGKSLRFNAVVERHNNILAAAIVLIESMVGSAEQQ